MKYQKDLGFAIIKRDLKISLDITRIFSNSYKKNKKLFGKKPKKFNIIICDTEKEFKKQAKYYYFKWGTATVLRNNNLITRSPDFVEKIGKWKKSDFQNIINHEMNHVFWGDFYGSTKPCWLLEGLACHVGKNFLLSKEELRKLLKKYNVDESLLDYRYLKRNFKEHYPRYPIWANFTNFIAKKYSIKKLIKFMSMYTKNPNFLNYKNKFKSEFKKDEKDMFKEFIKSIKF